MTSDDDEDDDDDEMREGGLPERVAENCGSL